MKIRLVTIGKTDTGWISTGMAVYRERLGHYINFSVTELPDIRNAASLGREQIKEREGEMLLKNLAANEYAVLLDERGKEYTSTGLAGMIGDRLSHFSGNMAFVIGGAYGFSDSVYARADTRISLSRMTFSHQMVRVIFLEQLYRAFTIIRGEPYHHE